VPDTETSSKQRFYEKNRLYTVTVKNLERLRKREVTQLGMSIDIAGESAWKTVVEIDPAATPNFNIESQQ
jgi:hypothetical protein